ncbi:MAG: AmmeMemoRadiSam system radical SAM enzyme [Desulfobacteraceae bacterium]|nr:AmmeMemoRadiSam system radical SAM enzyme [Desulfobacteraceae bacterium]MBC2756140.1 AmmeMemoRadiSam system radical SAM enzyme [Desulfobacteraceae bacterium]
MKTTRRELLKIMGRGACTVGSLPLVLKALGIIDNPVFADESYPEAKYYKKLSGKRVQCTLCPMEHVLANGERGPCRTRENHQGTLLTHAYNNPAIIKIDPMEKLPSTHFLPDTKTLTIATGGCNLHCLYCQNWQQSQSRPEDLKTIDLSAVEAVKQALGKEIKTIAFSYTEPFMFYEYAIEIAKKAKEKGMRIAIATGGYINEKPLLELCKHADIITVGLKAFTEECYEKLTERSLEHVLETIKTIKKGSLEKGKKKEKEKLPCLEITNLIVPTYNDKKKMIREMCQWIKKELGEDVPLHFGRFVPRYKLKNLPQAPLRSLEEAREIAFEEGIRFVYLSNVAPHDGNNTYCPKCKKAIIKRIGFKVLENNLKDGKCKFCDQKIPGVWK